MTRETRAQEAVNLSREARIYFRDTLRDARSIALRDSEGFTAILFAIERLGRFLSGRGSGLGQYQRRILELAGASPLSRAQGTVARSLHIPIDHLFALIQEGRNSALHEGAFARHLTSRSIELSLIIEDALTMDMRNVADFMTRGPTCASAWQPLSFVRQTMLATSFSYLPVWTDWERESKWRLVSDFALADYLRSAESNADRARRLSQSLQDAVAAGLTLQAAFVCTGDCSAQDALRESNSMPILVRGDRAHELVGIAAPFDLL
jgi:hypothetical protein